MGDTVVAVAAVAAVVAVAAVAAVVAAATGNVRVDNIVGAVPGFVAGVEIGTGLVGPVVEQQVFDSCPPLQGFAWMFAYCSPTVAFEPRLLRHCW